MIKVKISRNKSNLITGFQVRGHAGSDTQGKDLVCCAVSSIVQTAIMGLKLIACVQADIKMEKGKVICSIVGIDDLSGDKQLRSAAILDTMVLGLKSLRKDYNDFLSIDERIE